MGIPSTTVLTQFGQDFDEIRGKPIRPAVSTN